MYRGAGIFCRNLRLKTRPAQPLRWDGRGCIQTRAWLGERFRARRDCGCTNEAWQRQVDRSVRVVPKGYGFSRKVI